MSIDDRTASSPDVYDVFDSRALRNPYPCYAALRHRMPLYHHTGRDCWLVSRHADVSSVLRGGEHVSNVPASFESTLLGGDGSAHLRIRRIVSALFPRMASLHAFIEATARQLVDNMLAHGGGDVINDLARPLPTSVMAHVLGIPMTTETARWIEASIAAAATGYGAPPGDGVEAALAEFDLRMIEEVRRQRHSLTTGLIGEMTTPSAGHGLSEREIADIARLLVIAGSETTTNLIGNMVSILMEHRDALAILLANPDRLPEFMEEALRFESPVQVTQRLTTRPLEIAGGVVPAGACIVALIGSANRDDAVFANGDRFLFDRRPAGHLAFGYGPHACLGAHLSRVEAKIALSILLPHLRDVEPEPVDELPYRTFPTRGPLRLWLRFHDA